jgi:outer membrane protein assembly factor BamB
MKRLLSCLALAALALSCGGGGTSLRLFSTDWSDDRGASMERVRMRLGGARASAAADVVVGVAGNADKIVGYPLGGGAKWTFAHPLDARPVVTGSVVVGLGNGELFALDAVKGTKLWARKVGRVALHGAGDDGGVTVITMSDGGKGSVLMAVTRDGQIVRRVETDKLLGAPAVLSRIAFVPWSNQYVSAVDLANGDEAGRVVLREKVSRAWTENHALYFGEVGIFRFDANIRQASSGAATHVTLPVRELPGTPLLMQSGNERLPPVAGATDRIRLYARPSGGDGPLTIEGDRFFATYFRIVMGFEAKGGRLSWVHLHPQDILGGDAGNGGLALCDEQGKITILSSQSGVVATELDLGEPVRACIVQIDEFTPPSAPSKGESLAVQIARSVQSHEPQLATGNRFLLRELATLDDEMATKTLVELASDQRASPPLVADARVALASRKNGARYMVDALGKHYDFLKDVLRPPPVGPMAQALAAMNERSAAPALAAHLIDPNDTEDDIRYAAQALVTIGGPSEVPTLKQFFGMYRANADGEEMNAAVVSAAQALLKLAGKDGRAIVDQAITDPMTVSGAKERLTAIVHQLDAEKGEQPAPKQQD